MNGAFLVLGNIHPHLQYLTLLLLRFHFSSKPKKLGLSKNYALETVSRKLRYEVLFDETLDSKHKLQLLRRMR